MLNNITNIIKKEIDNKNSKIFLCIGTSSCIGDSLGPKVGEILSKQIRNKNIKVFGNLKNNVHYRNIHIILNEIYQEFYHPYFIIIDSALSHKNYIGNIIINKKSMIIGEALNKQSYPIGNISIKGIVGENNNHNVKNLNTLRKVKSEIVEDLSKNISSQILQALGV